MSLFDVWPKPEELLRRGHAARMAADDGVTPVAGGVYTVSPDFVCGDRSWIDHFWRVVGISGPNALVHISGQNTDVQRLFRVDERAWYPVPPEMLTPTPAPHPQEQERNDDL